MVSRPVDVSPVQNAFPIVDPVTGKATETFQRFLLNLWERTGGFTDEFFEILTVANLGQIQGLIATGQNEALARALGDVAAQGRLDGIDRLSGQIEALVRQFGALQGVSTSALSPQPKTRVIVFDADDTYSAGSDVRSIDVYCIGGGGGGGRGSIISNGGGGGGGGGGGYTYATMNAATLPSVIAVEVGAAGSGGSSGTAATAGGYSAFGTLLYANGGNFGAAGTIGVGGAGGAVTALYGNLFRGGPGTNGDLVSAADAVNDYQGAPGGGGGGGYNSGSGGDGAAGSWRALTATGGGGAGGAAGVSGSPGATAGASDVYFGPGYGGGGGGGATTDNGGNGGDGIVGGGGGGGGATGSASVVSGNGGNGGAGRVIVVEHL
jgi:hypothetical protein